MGEFVAYRALGAERGKREEGGGNRLPRPSSSSHPSKTAEEEKKREEKNKRLLQKEGKDVGVGTKEECRRKR